MAYAPALSIGSPLATYAAISSGESVTNQTRVTVDPHARPLCRRRQTPVITSCCRPESNRSMRAASTVSAGLPRMQPSITTTVSAPSTISSAPASTARALARANRLTQSCGDSPVSGVSSTAAGRITNSKPACLRISARRGDWEARISMPLFRMRVAFEIQFAGFDAHAERILLRWQRARCICRESAGRVVGAVEIQNHFAFARQLGVQKAARWICLLAAGEVAEHEEKLIVFGDRFQAILFAAQRECHVARAGGRRRLTEDVGNRNHFRLRIRNECGSDPVFLFNGKPAESWKIMTRWAGVVPETNTEALATHQHLHGETSQRGHIRRL